MGGKEISFRVLRVLRGWKRRWEFPRGAANSGRAVGSLDVFGFGALLAGNDFEDDFLTLVECLEAVAHDRRVMDEDVLPTLLRNEAQALFIVPPFNFAFSHITLS
jgi:hypothetical protein